MDRFGCPNTLPGAECVDPECAYCRVAESEEPKQAEKVIEPYDDKA